MSPAWEPVAPDALADRLGAWLARTQGIVRVAVDGPPCADPSGLADSLTDPLRALGRRVAHVRAASFWHDASLRFEHGREDADAYLSWLDAAALRREVLEPAVDRGSYLPSLRDPATNRSTRALPRDLDPDAVLLVSGSVLLGLGLPFDRTVHIAISPPARRRRTALDDAWMLPAFDAYDASARPASIANVTIKWDDRQHPAVRWDLDERA